MPAVPSEEIVKKLSAEVTLSKVEKTFRTDFISVLHDVLAPHGLDIKDEIRITVCGEQVRSPDLFVLERGKYREVGDVLHIQPGGLKAIIETKHPKRFAILVWIIALFKISKYTKAGKRWFTYGSHILYRDDPLKIDKILIGGHIAIIEKFRTKTRECIALHSVDQLTGSNSYFFGVVRSTPLEGDKPKQQAFQEEQILAAWFSSTVFLALYLYNRREISGDYGRIKIGDMASFPCINPSLVSDHNRRSIVKEFEVISQEKLPTIYEQLKTRRLRNLDKSILRAIGINDNILLDSLYTVLLHELDTTETSEDQIALPPRSDVERQVS
jgi:hypothetical protein